MGVLLHRATRADRLVAGLGDVLATPLPDPFATEIVAVPTRGVERWLAQSLSHVLGASGNGSADGDAGAGVDGRAGSGGRAQDAAIGSAGRDGICAGVDFWSPDRMVGQALSGVTGIDPRDDPWLPRRAVWSLLPVIDAGRGQSWSDPLWRYLDRSAVDQPDRHTFGEVDQHVPPDEPRPATSPPGRRFATALHLAELMHSYAGNRPQMIEAWIAGHDVDGAGDPLPAALSWQAELWRRLRAEIGVAGPAERLREACRALTADPDSSDLPERLSVFGPTRLPYATLAVLAALARHRDVHLWLPHPSPALWAAAARTLERAAPDTRPANTGPTDAGPADIMPVAPGRRSADPTAALPRHRLLGYLGRDSRELQLGLAQLPADLDDDLLDPPHLPLPSDTDRPRPDRPDGLLTRLQDDLAADRPLGTPGPEDRLAVDDDSIAIHAAHGPDRQVEVLRELLLGLLADDPTLEPRDIIVMCPDIETFAPLISAAFGHRGDDDDITIPGHPGHQLRVRLADRSLRLLNPLLDVLSRLFDLAESRVEASAILDLCSTAPVARQFDFTDDDLHRLLELVTRSGVRWGLDPRDRGRFGMDGFAQNTWTAGLDRMLLGVAMDEEGEHYLGTTLPLDDVDAGDADLIGRLTELVHRLGTVIAAFDRTQSLRAWIGACREALELLTAVAPADSAQLGQAYGELARIADSATGRDDVLLTRREARALLADLFAGRPSRANFRTGTLTVATLMPMRSVPHRVVCLLGLDDGVFPRSGRIDGDDLLVTDPWIGDRDRRSEDRQLLLDAIMSAGDRLMIIYSGADPRTNADKPPSVPLGELLDALDQTALAADGGPVREQIVHRHPLQPFDPANFTPSGVVAETGLPFSFDPDGLAGAGATLVDRVPPPPVFDRTKKLPPYALPEVIQLNDLISFFSHPVRFLLRTRTGLSQYEDEAPELETMPITLDPLQAWSIGDRMLRSQLSGVDLDRLVGAEWRRGQVPPRAMGQRVLEPVAVQVAEIAERARPLLAGQRRNVDVSARLEVADGSGGFTEHLLVGTVPSVYDSTLTTVQYSRLGAKHRLQSWLKLLAMTATDPQPWRAITVGNVRRKPDTAQISAVPPQFARLVLADLLDLFRTGLSEPLPLGIQTAAEYAQVRHERPNLPIINVGKRLTTLWERDFDQAYQTFYGPVFSYQQLIAIKAVPAEARGRLAEPSRFGTLARRVWQPLLSAEELS